MKKPIVDKNTCISCGTCTAMCPNTFKMGEDFKAEAYQVGESEQEIQTVIDSCPVNAISWTEE